MTCRASACRRSLGTLLVLFSIALAGCGGGEEQAPLPGPTPDGMKIFMLDAGIAQFGTVTDGAPFSLTLSRAEKDVIWFSDRPLQTAGTDTLANLVGGIWPRTFGSLAPNALLKATVSDQEPIQLFCMLDKPAYDASTGQLRLQATYLNGNRKPTTNLAVTDVKLILLNNLASAEDAWSQLMHGEVCTFEPTSTSGTYLFRMQSIAGDVFSYTSAPGRLSAAIPPNYYLSTWAARFRSAPPNVSIAYDPVNNPAGGIQIATLTDPSFDMQTGAVTFTAKRLYGTAPIGPAGLTVTRPTIFLDGGNSDQLIVKVANHRNEDVWIRFCGKAVEGSAPDGGTLARNLKIAKNAEQTFNVAKLDAGRIYVSCAEALQSTFEDGDHWPDGANPGDNSSGATPIQKALYHDYRTRFDWVEMTYIPGWPSVANLTAVDAYAIPMALTTFMMDGLAAERLTLADGIKGADVSSRLAGLIDKVEDQIRPAIIKNDAGVLVRTLAPNKNAACYPSFDDYLAELSKKATTVDIVGAFLKLGDDPKPYDYTGVFDADNIVLKQPGAATITIPLETLRQNKSNAKDTNGIYTCNAHFLVGADWRSPGDNDLYSAVNRDLMAGLNLGYVKPGLNGSSEGWWASKVAFQEHSNPYAKLLYELYPGAYGFPFNDIRFKVLAHLGGAIDTMGLTILRDDETPPPVQNPSHAAVDPQKDDPLATFRWNLGYVTPPAKYLASATDFTITFDRVAFKGGWIVNDFDDANPANKSIDNHSGQICGIPARAGWNFYHWRAFGQDGLVMVKFAADEATLAGVASGAITGNMKAGAGYMVIGFN